MDLLDRLLGHNEWATARILELSRDLTDAQLDQPFDLGNGTLRETLDHIVYVIHFWTEQMLGRSVVEDPGGTRTIADLIEWHERFHPAFAAFARRAHDDQRLDETFLDHYNIRKSLGGTILQVCHHCAQHRAEAQHMLKRLGVADLWDYDPQEWEYAIGHVPLTNP